MRFHTVDYVSLIFGVFFTVVAGLFLFTNVDAFDLDVRWIGPAALVVIGLAFLLPSRRRAAELPAPHITDPEVEAAKEELFPSPLD